jgi:chromosome segregation ATPase
MSDIGLILNGLLGVLLLGALALGWRLEGRLKALRASQASFTRAVEDLDRAAARAEQGLADLRAATDEAAESLAGRIERAKGLSSKLELLTREATNIEARMAAQPRPAASREAALARFSERFGSSERVAAEPRAAPARRAGAPPRSDLILEDAAEPTRADPPALAERLARLRRLAERQSAVEPRDRSEDDLFTGAARRAGGAGR